MFHCSKTASILWGTGTHRALNLLGHVGLPLPLCFLSAVGILYTSHITLQAPGGTCPPEILGVPFVTSASLGAGEVIQRPIASPSINQIKNISKRTCHFDGSTN